MSQNTLTWTKPERQTTRSKVMFIGDFKEELQKVVDAMEELIENELPKHVKVDSVLAGRHEIKIRINDEEKGITRRINCIFRYHHDEMRFGSIRIELNSHEFSRETRVHFVGTFKITDRKEIGTALLGDLVRYATKE